MNKRKTSAANQLNNRYDDTTPLVYDDGNRENDDEEESYMYAFNRIRSVTDLNSATTTGHVKQQESSISNNNSGGGGGGGQTGPIHFQTKSSNHPIPQKQQQQQQQQQGNYYQASVPLGNSMATIDSSLSSLTSAAITPAPPGQGSGHQHHLPAETPGSTSSTSSSPTSPPNQNQNNESQGAGATTSPPQPPPQAGTTTTTTTTGNSNAPSQVGSINQQQQQQQQQQTTSSRRYSNMSSNSSSARNSTGSVSNTSQGGNRNSGSNFGTSTANYISNPTNPTPGGVFDGYPQSTGSAVYGSIVSSTTTPQVQSTSTASTKGTGSRSTTYAPAAVRTLSQAADRVESAETTKAKKRNLKASLTKWRVLCACSFVVNFVFFLAIALYLLFFLFFRAPEIYIDQIQVTSIPFPSTDIGFNVVVDFDNVIYKAVTVSTIYVYIAIIDTASSVQYNITTPIGMMANVTLPSNQRSTIQTMATFSLAQYQYLLQIQNLFVSQRYALKLTGRLMYRNMFLWHTKPLSKLQQQYNITNQVFRDPSIVIREEQEEMEEKEEEKEFSFVSFASFPLNSKENQETVSFFNPPDHRFLISAPTTRHSAFPWIYDENRIRETFQLSEEVCKIKSLETRIIVNS